MRKLFTLFISMLIVLGICMPVSAEDQSSTYSVSVTPDKISLPSVTEGYAPQDPKTIIIKNTGNQTILLEDYGKPTEIMIRNPRVFCALSSICEVCGTEIHMTALPMIDNILDEMEYYMSK